MTGPGYQPVVKPYLGDVLDYYDVVYDRGRMSQKALCPVHDDHIKSCSINLEEEGWYNCLACGSKGDSLNLIMEKEGIGFAAALKFAEGIATDGSHKVSVATESRGEALLGRTRPERRDDHSRGFRPSFRRDGA